MSDNLPTVTGSSLPAEIIEKVVVSGDLSKLTPSERVSYYSRVCESVGLNPLTQPFEYIRLNGTLKLYAKRDATDQLRALRKVSVIVASREKVGDVYAVTARATTPDGRTDESIGAVAIANLKGDALANALMKAETKAKRRVTLSIVGLGWLDESEVETIPGARVAPEYHDTPALGLGEAIPEDPQGPLLDGMDEQEPEPERDSDDSLPADLSHVKRELYSALMNWPAEKRDEVLRHYSRFEKDGRERAIMNIEAMLSPKCSDKWAGTTLGRVREAIDRLGSRQEIGGAP